jgi:glycosyltransferase involved in cell wall biosynthesis
MILFIINVSMISSVPTGLSIYAERCAKFIEHRIKSTIISSHYKACEESPHVVSPKKIGIANGPLAAYLRIIYSFLRKHSNNVLIYTPTHHGFFRHKNQIVTIHDLIPINYPSQHKFQYLYFKWFLPLIVNNAKAIFTVSETVKKEISNYYKIPNNKIFVVPCGIDTTIFNPIKIRASQENDDYLLVVGASYPHKNIVELFENWILWKGRYKVKIVSSRGSYKRHLLALVNKYELANDVVFFGCVSSIELVSLLQKCSALVYPSLFEGFGLPPLEAMACGRPVIVSDIEVHKEIMKNVPLYITPGDKESWRNAFNLLQDESIVRLKIEQGIKLVKEYSWAHSGEILLESLLNVEPELTKILKSNNKTSKIENEDDALYSNL